MPGTQNASHKRRCEHTTCWEPTVTQSGSKLRLPTWKGELKADGCICIHSGQCKSAFLGKVWKKSWLSMGKTITDIHRFSQSPLAGHCWVPHRTPIEGCALRQCLMTPPAPPYHILPLSSCSSFLSTIHLALPPGCTRNRAGQEQL